MRNAKMWLVGTTVALLGIGSGHAQQSSQKPPLETYLHTTNENGNIAMTVIYHANGTFEMEIAPTTGKLALGTQNAPYRRMLSHKTGRWWWSVDGRFCFHLEGRNEFCKSNGHYIGRS